jgi:hypothetical protein
MRTKLGIVLFFFGQFLIVVMRNIMRNILRLFREWIRPGAFSGKISSYCCEIIVLKKQKVINHELTINLCLIAVI